MFQHVPELDVSESNLASSEVFVILGPCNRLALALSGVWELKCRRYFAFRNDIYRRVHKYKERSDYFLFMIILDKVQKAIEPHLIVIPDSKYNFSVRTCVIYQG